MLITFIIKLELKKVSEDSFDYVGKTCGECAYLTDKYKIKAGDISEKEAGLCRALILRQNFAVMYRDEVACPDFLPR